MLTAFIPPSAKPTSTMPAIGFIDPGRYFIRVNAFVNLGYLTSGHNWCGARFSADFCSKRLRQDASASNRFWIVSELCPDVSGYAEMCDGSNGGGNDVAENMQLLILRYWCTG